MFTEKQLAVAGVFLLVVGMFLPIWHDENSDFSPDWIDIDPEDNIEADGPGVYILILAAVALFLLLMNRPEYTWATTALIFVPLFVVFASVWYLMFNDTGTGLGISWAAIAGGLILMIAPFWPEPLKIYLGWMETTEEVDIPEENSEPIQEELA